MTQLITLDRARQAIPDFEEDQDSVLEPLVEGASAAIERVLGRTFDSTDYDEFQDGDECEFVIVDHFPVTAVDRVSAYPTTMLWVANTDDDTNSRATVSVSSTGIRLRRVASGVSDDETITFATAPTMVSLASAINVLGSGWTAVLVTGWSSAASADLIVLGGQPCLGTYASLEAMSEEITCESVDLETGALELAERIVRGTRNVRIAYTAGYATVPDDVQLGCATMVANAYRALSRDGGLRSEQIGDYRFTRENDGVWTPEVRRLLMPFKEYSV